MSVLPLQKHFCDFCGKSQDDVGTIIAGPRVDICDECVELSCEIMEWKVTKPLVAPISSPEIPGN